MKSGNAAIALMKIWTAFSCSDFVISNYIVSRRFSML